MPSVQRYMAIWGLNVRPPWIDEEEDGEEQVDGQLDKPIVSTENVREEEEKDYTMEFLDEFI